MALKSPSQGLPLRVGQGGAAPVHAQKARDTKTTFKRLWKYLLPQKVGLLATAIMVAGGAALDVLGPYLLGRAIDDYVIPRDLPGLLKIAALMLLVYATNAALNWTQLWVMTGVSLRTVASLRTDLFEKLGDLPLEFFDKHSHGDLMSRLTNDVESINNVLSSAAQQVISGVLSTFGIACMMFYLNVPLALVTIASTAFLTFAANRWLANFTLEGFRAQQRDLGLMGGYIEEVIGGARVVKVCGREAGAIAEFEEVSAALKRSSTKAQIYAGFAGPLMNTITNTGIAAVGGFGGILALQGMASVGLIATFLNYARQFGRPLNEVANLYNSMQSALAAAERVFEIIDEPQEIDAAPQQGFTPIKGDVEFDDVSFGYDTSRLILKNVSFTAHQGQTIALIGPTGAGKTTIVSLLTRFYEIGQGAIKIDGRDIREIPKEQLHSQIAVVLQDTYLFSASIRDNIRYGKLDATDAQVEAAARQANAHFFISHLPHGYETLVSERGSNLSQGQQQLISIARAILTDPRILVLDEATSSVDTRTEKHIQEAMQLLMRGRTSFVIAHRLSTIREADQILVIGGGEIIERGNHEQLLRHDGFYARAVGMPASLARSD